MKKLYLLSGILFLISATVSGQLSVTTGVTPATMVNTILGSGVTVSNVTYTGAANARGTFTWGTTGNGGFANGILLTSGSATVAALANTQSGQGQDNQLATTDAQLNTLTTGQTQDVCKLEFDFSVASDSVAFSYIFASEEYSDYVNTPCNDVFGFFISGPGITGQKNIAIVPGTNPPVSMTINNVNNGLAAHGVPPPGPCEYCQYFMDNTVPVAYTTAYDGLTTTLVAGSLVQPCATYHIKLAIGDVCDGIFDSGVFLKANSFSSFGPNHILVNGVSHETGDSVFVCPGSSVTLSANPAPNYLWNTGATTQSIVVNEANLLPNGIYQLQIAFGNCFTFSTIRVVFQGPSATITPSGPTTFCSGSSVTLNAPTGANKTYQWKKGTNLISGATLSSYTATTGGNYRVTVTNTATGCSKTTGSPTVVTVNTLPAATITPQGPTTFCAGGSVVLQANTGTGLTYKWKKGSSYISGATLSNYTAAIAGNYRVQVTKSNGCSKTSALVAVSVPCKEGVPITIGIDFTVYPNPNSGEFTIKFSTKPTSPIQIELTDEIGKVVKRFETAAETIVIKEATLTKGIYCLTVRNKDKVTIKKINIVK
ncbi:MAG TPA: choice-of-anchor L domain-containing protein [Bacteroidia bacterium]|nr:choice-of-anchor L domain-containing protein [Bacteroidia bacterium]